jgi:Rps23 Pro-64 3,4-dihydroxylase Tpa1-like proline 4-hydroxylase
MNCQFYNEPFDHILITNTYTIKELIEVWKEIDQSSLKLKGPEHTMSAFNDTGVYKKKNKGFFVDYDKDKDKSSILKFREKFVNNVTCDVSGIIFKYYPSLNPNKKIWYDFTSLVSYYEDGDYYEPHRDSSLFTSVTFLKKEESKFTGGQLNFPEYNLSIDPKNNTTIIFPSIVEHQVLPMNGSGRYSITNFIDMSSSCNDTQIKASVGDIIDLSKIPNIIFS